MVLRMSKPVLDAGKGSDSVAVAQGVHVYDGMKHKTVARIDKFTDPENIIHRLVTLGCPMEILKRAFADKYLGTVEFDSGDPDGNLCLNSGIQGFEKLIAGLSSPPTAWNNASAYLGVGDSTVAAAATQTDLQASTNYTYVGMASGYPSQSSQTLSWQSSFGSAQANYAWNEFVVSDASSKGSGTCLNRLVSSQGTKTSGQTWVLTLSITWS
jgi:hypothetical protein